MPAHLGIADVLGSGLALGTQFLPKAGVEFLARRGMGRAAVWDKMSATTKGRATIKEANGGHSHGGYLTPSGAAALLEKQRQSREIHCDDYQSYRQALDGFKYAGMNIWPEKGYDYVDTIVKLNEGSGYDMKGHEHFKEEWELYLKQGTAFDSVVHDFLSRGWSVVLIKGLERHVSQLIRIEATTSHKTKSGKKLVILWTST